ncbi:MAG: hypothetical protein K6E40_16310, partial [Desulfovibrio sp.]|nr:hypothetical protein [Desulfovibrio sp.]
LGKGLLCGESIGGAHAGRLAKSGSNLQHFFCDHWVGLNLEKINPIKRAKIEKGIDLIEKCNAKEKVVDKMIIFGSSTGDECTEESDIDLPIQQNFSLDYYRQ